MHFFKNIFLLLATVVSALTVAVAAWGSLNTLKASSEATSAEASFLLSEAQLEDLRTEEQENASRLLEIPNEQTAAWKLCTNVIMDNLFDTGATDADEAGCEEWRQLEAEKELLNAREESLPNEIENARDNRNSAQIDSLTSGREFSTALVFAAGGTGLLAMASIALWVFGARKAKNIVPNP